MKPYAYFVRALEELYKSAEIRKIKTPRAISRGEFANLNYQIDAIKQGVECLEKYSGVIVADVVGLGKSIVASAIAYNISLPRTVIIAPPHLKAQWEKYAKKFQLQNTEVVSSGKISELYREAGTGEATLYMIDEAHRYRNENTTMYKMLHQIVRAHPENKVMLLTATPYNNHPRDIYALVKLFQIPSRATLNTVDNLGLRFGQLIAEYNQLEKLSKAELSEKIKREMREIAERMRMMIEPIIIRRSRVDLVEVKKYAEDLGKQKISFAKVCDPKTIQYSLGELSELYYRTLAELNAGEFTGAKYKPLTYLHDVEKFNEKYKDVFSYNRTQQLNMAKLAQRIFVLRFESSQYAFRKTLEKMIASHRETVRYWWEEKTVAISKSKTLDKLDGEVDENFTIASENLNREFVEDVEMDLTWLEKVYQAWFAHDKTNDPKQERVEITLRELQRENPERKIVIFTSYADTAEYVVRKLQKSGMTRTLLYTSDSNQAQKNIVTRNFDAALKQNEREDEYDIIVATDALSEGFNLHRAGVIINYDIPYNPTRVVQRIGRINRIDQRTFMELKVYNMFPTAIGEKIVNVKGISSLKMLLMNQIIGNDTKVLTEDEDVESFFQRQYRDANSDENEAAWDNEYRNIYHAVRAEMKNLALGEKVIARKRNEVGVKSIAMVRRGKNIVFLGIDDNNNVSLMNPEKTLKILSACEDEEAMRVEETKSLERFRQELEKPYELPKMLGNRGYALDVIEALNEICADEKSYLDKLCKIVRRYDDLCEAELQSIARVKLDDVAKAVQTLKMEIPEWYLDAVERKVQKIESAKSEIVFVEDFR